MSFYTANTKLYENSSGAIGTTGTVLAFNGPPAGGGAGDVVPDATVTANGLLTAGLVTLQTGGGVSTPFTPLSREIANATYQALDQVEFSALNHGIVADGTDQATAINAWLTSLGSISKGTLSSHVDASSLTINPVAFFPAGTYGTSATLSVPAGVAVRLDPSATIKATGTISGAVFAWPASTLTQDRGITGGGVIDCDSKAANGLSVPYFAHFEVECRVHNSTSHSIILGDTGAPASSFEAIISRTKVWRARDKAAMTAGGYGIWFKNASDSKIAQTVINGASASGVRLDTQSNHLQQVHVWNYSVHGNPTDSFDDNAGKNFFVSCYADTPATNGFHLRAENTTLSACKVFLNTFSGVDNTVDAVHVDSGGHFFTCVGLNAQGADGSHRLANDFSGDLTNATIVGTQTLNVVAGHNGTLLPGITILNGGSVSYVAASTSSFNGKRATISRVSSLLDSGAATLSRLEANSNAVTLTSGKMHLTYFTPDQSFTSTQVRLICGSQAMATATLFRIGLYTVDGSGNLALVASTPSDTSLMASTSTAYTKALSVSYSVVDGTRYALGVLAVATTPPKLQGVFPTIASECGQSPRLNGSVSSLADLPASVAVGSVGNDGASAYGVCLP